ncbi:MAG: hypothetical protein N2Z67_04300 [Acetobacteraceae bacterium]|nr:hypothetical protein [Acetobacteraceae bacterium]
MPLLAILAGAAALLWPAFLNGYPLLFSDSGAFLHQTLGPLMIWDKPWIYGPFLHAFHWRITLWGPAAAQAVMLSWLLWLVQRAVLGRASPGAHLLLAAAVSALTTAPFSAALLMPDILAPASVLCLFLLGLGRASLAVWEAWLVGLIGAVAIASHLSHLPLALAMVVLTLVLSLRLRPALRAALPLLAAVVLLFGTNWAGHGRLSLSPHGSTFLLARLIADGPAARTIAAECPGRGWYLCAWAGRLPEDSDVFLWAPDSPVNRDAAGRDRFLGGALLSDEAREILAETLRREPLAVMAAMARNALRQALMVSAGDTLPPDHFAAAVAPRIREGFPPREFAAFEAGLQARGLLAEAVAPLLPVAPWVLFAALLASPVLLWRSLAQGRRMAARFLLVVLVALGANALATGGLSKPHLRYQARIAWLLPFAVALLLLPGRRREEAALQARGRR